MRTISSAARSDVPTDATPTATGRRSSQRRATRPWFQPASQNAPRRGSSASSHSPDSAPTAMNTMPGMLTSPRNKVERKRARTRCARWAPPASAPYANAASIQGRTSSGAHATSRWWSGIAPASAIARITKPKSAYGRPRAAQAYAGTPASTASAIQRKRAFIAAPTSYPARAVRTRHAWRTRWATSPRLAGASTTRHIRPSRRNGLWKAHRLDVRRAGSPRAVRCLLADGGARRRRRARGGGGRGRDSRPGRLARSVAAGGSGEPEPRDVQRRRIERRPRADHVVAHRHRSRDPGPDPGDRRPADGVRRPPDLHLHHPRGRHVLRRHAGDDGGRRVLLQGDQEPRGECALPAELLQLRPRCARARCEDARGRVQRALLPERPYP